MEARLQLRVQRYGWDRAAEHYERGWREPLFPAQDLLFKMGHLEPGFRVLDIACGTGLVALRAARFVAPHGRVIGVDISDQMVERANELAASSGLPNVSFYRMEAEQLDCVDDYFDVAYDSLGLMYVPDPGRAVEEMHRVIRPGGRAVTAVWGARNHCGWAEIFPIVDSRVKTEVCPLFFQLGTGNSLAELYRAVGFREVMSRRIQTTLHYRSASEALNAVFAGGPVALAYARFDEQTREAAHAEYLQSIEPYRKGTEYHIPGEFVVVGGRKGRKR
ncbi:MAG: methyltransferase domain-containing protein [Saprospiraceae bacterium]|nr:methyltransferase domain-containing protein [Saprospiraceae bacterium]